MRIGTTVQEVMYGTNKTEDGQELDITHRVEMAAADKMVIANQLKTNFRVEGVPLAYNSLCVRFYISRKTALALKRDEPKDGRVNGGEVEDMTPSLAEMVRKYDRIPFAPRSGVRGFIDKIEVVYHVTGDMSGFSKEAAETLRELSLVKEGDHVDVDSILCTFTDNQADVTKLKEVTMTFTQNLLEKGEEVIEDSNAISERFAAKAVYDPTQVSFKNGILATVALIGDKLPAGAVITYNEQHFEPDRFGPHEGTYYPHTLVTKWKRDDHVKIKYDDGEEEAFPLGRCTSVKHARVIDKPGKIVEVLSCVGATTTPYRTEQEKFVAHPLMDDAKRQNFVGIQFGSATNLDKLKPGEALSFIDGLVPDTAFATNNPRYDTVDGTTFKKEPSDLGIVSGNTVDNGDVGITMGGTGGRNRKTMVYSTREFPVLLAPGANPVQNIKEKDVVTNRKFELTQDMVWGAINSDPSYHIYTAMVRAMRNYNNAPNYHTLPEINGDEMMFIGNQRILGEPETFIGLLERSNELLQTELKLMRTAFVDDMHARILRKKDIYLNLLRDADGLTPRYIKDGLDRYIKHFTTYTESEVDRGLQDAKIAIVCENDQQRMIVSYEVLSVGQRIDKGQFDSIILGFVFAYYLGLTGMLKHFGINTSKAPREMTELSLMGKSISHRVDKDKTEPLGTLAEVFGVAVAKKPRSHVIVGMDKNSQL
ncbi:hypothetical protein SPFM10_00029 [Salmonella phage SPFM10]|nr:hypothetical protein SPFM10_00029 [Salmonella phage SPFM10]